MSEIAAELEKSTRYPLLLGLLFFVLMAIAEWLGLWSAALVMAWCSGVFVGHGWLKHRIESLTILTPKSIDPHKAGE